LNATVAASTVESSSPRTSPVGATDRHGSTSSMTRVSSHARTSLDAALGATRARAPKLLPIGFSRDTAHPEVLAAIQWRRLRGLPLSHYCSAVGQGPDKPLNTRYTLRDSRTSSNSKTPPLPRPDLAPLQFQTLGHSILLALARCRIRLSMLTIVSRPTGPRLRGNPVGRAIGRFNSDARLALFVFCRAAGPLANGPPASPMLLSF
jgi:hypothetical protein